MAVCEQARYVLTDVAQNNNKFWTAELHEDGTVVTRWGRVGDDGQCKSFPSVGRSYFESKCREKQGKGYRAVRTLEGTASPTRAASSAEVEILATQQIETNDSETAQLVARLARANVHNILTSTTLNYDTSRGTFSTPLGIVTQDAIEEARRLLTRIGDYVEQDLYVDSGFARAVSDYLMLVPQNIGRGKPDLRRLYPDLQAVQTQNGILDSLEVSLQNALATSESVDETAAPEKVFHVRLHRVEDSAVIERIRRKYRQTQQGIHACAHLDVKAVYEIEVASMRQAFQEKGRTLGNVWELWHGTKIANLLSILKSGLCVTPPRSAHITGKMFGNGLYFSDQSTKSLNYAFGYWDGKREENCFMLLCDVAMGMPYTPRSYAETFPKPNYDSTFARAGVSGVGNNEMIVYRNEQVDLKYLVEFSPKGR
jgi:poly [ADP-ribose] polymerase